jgi:predicted P-loop ATPase
MDYALCLEGPQGVGKSQVARVLGGEYTSQDLPDFHSRDAQQIATTRWVIEVADLAAVGRSQLDKFKAFLTITADTYVPKYERYPVTRKRWSVFLMTVNLEAGGYLRDQTGNRRVWPIAVGEIDIDRLAADRDQILAEAVACYRRGDRWWPETTEQNRMLTEAQEERTVSDPWTETISEWAFSRVGEFSTLDAALGLGLQPKDVNRSHETRIGAVLNKLGFIKRRGSRNGARVWLYRRP